MSMNENNNLKEVKPVELKKCVELKKRKFNSSTPQSHLDASIFHFNLNDGAIASEAGWLGISLQLKNFLIGYGVDAGSHKLKNEAVFFLEYANKEFKDKLVPAWLSLEQSHYNAYEDDCVRDLVENMLESAKLFCNILNSINNKKSFKRDVFLNWLPENLMLELKVPIGRKWKRIEVWINLGKMKLEGERPNMRLITL
ncbi:hypothetical protein ACQ4LE_010489 [Meloidogyne hapla]|uniref:Uncharacterized protein n=1 Tax=Meloidogyne hapla TaxID=6305 RepID=A0A1I8C3L6_MELHA